MSYIGKTPTAVPLTSSDITDGIISESKLGANAVTTGKITDGTVAQADISDQAINEAKMQISNAPTNGYFLSAQSGNTGGMTWASAGGGGVLQIKFGSHSASQYSTTSSSYTDVGSDYEVSITPSSSSNYILVYVQCANQNTTSTRAYYTISKPGDSSNNGDQHGNLHVSADSLANQENINGANDYLSFVYMDKNVNSTNALTYKLRYKVGSGTTYVGSAGSGNFMMAIELDGGIF